MARKKKEKVEEEKILEKARRRPEGFDSDLLSIIARNHEKGIEHQTRAQLVKPLCDKTAPNIAFIFKKRDPVGVALDKKKMKEAIIFIHNNPKEIKKFREMVADASIDVSNVWFADLNTITTAKKRVNAFNGGSLVGSRKGISDARYNDAADNLEVLVTIMNYNHKRCHEAQVSLDNFRKKVPAKDIPAGVQKKLKFFETRILDSTYWVNMLGTVEPFYNSLRDEIDI